MVEYQKQQKIDQQKFFKKNKKNKNQKPNLNEKARESRRVKSDVFIFANQILRSKKFESHPFGVFLERFSIILSDLI